MRNSNMYLNNIIQKYAPKSLNDYTGEINSLKATLKSWANACFIEIIGSGSIAKGTAISIASDVDFLVSLKSNCNENTGGLKSIYESLYTSLNRSYSDVRKQNVSVRITLSESDMNSACSAKSLLYNKFADMNSAHSAKSLLHNRLTGMNSACSAKSLSYNLYNRLEVDITPARKQSGNTNNHSLWVSKLSTWKQTNIQRHINDVSQSDRTNEIKLLKIWRELNKLDFPSIYLEYLLINNILKYKPSGLDNLASNFWHILLELAKDNENPLLSTIIDPANTNNVLSDLLTIDEKNKIYIAAKNSIRHQDWGDIVW